MTVPYTFAAAAGPLPLSQLDSNFSYCGPLENTTGWKANGSALRFQADMSNATASFQFAFQTSTLNGFTSFNVIPNGSSTSASIAAYNSSDLNNNGGIAVAAGATAHLIYTFNSGSGTLLPMSFYVGAERMRINTTGNVGVGTTTDNTTRFSVNGGALANNNSGISISSGLGTGRLTTNASNFLTAIHTYFDAACVEISAGSTGGQVSGITMEGSGATTPRTVRLWTNSAERMRIDSSGNVLVGQTALSNPNGWEKTLQINAATYSALSLIQGSGQWDIANSNGFFDIYNSTNRRLRIDGSGDVTIGGVTNLARVNQVSGGVTFVSLANAAVSWQLGTSSAHNLDFLTGGTVKTRIDNTTGVMTVCVPTPTPAGGSTSARLVMGTTSGFGIYYGSAAPTVSAAQGSIYLRSDGAINARLYINTDGGTTWTAFNTAS